MLEGAADADRLHEIGEWLLVCDCSDTLLGRLRQLWQRAPDRSRNVQVRLGEPRETDAIPQENSKVRVDRKGSRLG